MAATFSSVANFNMLVHSASFWTADSIDASGVCVKRGSIAVDTNSSSVVRKNDCARLKPKPMSPKTSDVSRPANVVANAVLMPPTVSSRVLEISASSSKSWTPVTIGRTWMSAVIKPHNVPTKPRIIRMPKIWFATLALRLSLPMRISARASLSMWPPLSLTSSKASIRR